MVENGALSVNTSPTVFAGSSVTVQLRLYKYSSMGFPIDTETYPVTMEDLDISRLAEGVTATVLEDGRTVELRYESTGRDDEWVSKLGLAADGRYTAANEWRGRIYPDHEGPITIGMSAVGPVLLPAPLLVPTGSSL